MRLRIQIIAVAILLVVGIVLFPRPSQRVSPTQLISRALRVKQSPTAPMGDIERRLRSGCMPILEGSDTIDGADVWAVRLKIPPPAKYPWLELWIDKKSSSIIAWKEWGRCNGRVAVLSQFPKMSLESCGRRYR
jgi:hypothetical protein